MQRAMPNHEVVAWQEGMGDTGAHYAVVWSPPEAFFLSQRHLKAIFNLGAGVDRILAAPGLPDIPIYRLEDAGMAPQMAEYVIHSLSSVSRGFDDYRQTQGQAKWSAKHATDYGEWPVGVMGMGKLGAHVARAVGDLGYPVAGWARSPREIPGVQVFHGDSGLAAFLARTRVLVNLLPLTAATRGIIDHELLSALKPNAMVINIARGAHVVDDDLLAALDSGHVEAAVLDVFNEEPLPQGHPYWSHPKVRVTPHIAAITLESEAARQISEGIARLERGEQASGLVNRTTGY
jgi:Phosphoglycerate dehydrogenase and related dehydrogenases